MERRGAGVATGWDLSAARQVPATTARAQVVPWEGDLWRHSQPGSPLSAHGAMLLEEGYQV